MPEEKKGFEEFIEIFRGGVQVASDGSKHDGDGLIDRAVASFDPAFHEPPAVLGHPKDNMPAYGWVQELKADTVDGVKRLLARFKQVVPEFAEAVADGRFKKRSASFYPDGRLRHVGFLGAMPPAVKGLAEIPFSEEEQCIEFYDYEKSRLARLFSKIREFIIDKYDVETADQVISTWEVDDMKEEAARQEPEGPLEPAFSEPQPGGGTAMPDTGTISQAEFDAAIKKARQEARLEAQQQAAAEFAEQQAKEEKQKKIQVYLATPHSQGGPLPAWKDAGLAEFLESLDYVELIEFGEGEGKQERPGLDWAIDFLSGLTPGPEFGEHAGKADEPGPAKDDPEAIARAAVEFKETEAKAGRVITITQAVAHVTAENPK